VDDGALLKTLLGFKSKQKCQKAILLLLLIFAILQYILVQLGFNLRNRVTDIFESSSILIYFQTCRSIYAQYNGEMPYLIKYWIKNGELKRESKI
jgi:hypothetical protein